MASFRASEARSAELYVGLDARHAITGSGGREPRRPKSAHLREDTRSCRARPAARVEALRTGRRAPPGACSSGAAARSGRGRRRLGAAVRDPGGIGRAGIRLVELAVGLALVVLVLPVDAALREAGLVEQLADLGHRPHPPLVAECVLQLRTVRKLEVDVADHPMRDGVELRLVPDVGEVVVLRLLLLHRERLGAAEYVEHQDPVVVQRIANAAKIAAELLARLEAVVAEVERADDVDRLGLDRANVPKQQLHARAILLGKLAYAVRAAPLERLLVDIHADRDALRARAYPLARGARRAAEILAKADRLATPQLLERIDEVLDFAVDGLHGFLVKLVYVGLLRHREDGLSLRGRHRGVNPLRTQGQGAYCSEKRKSFTREARPFIATYKSLLPAAPLTIQSRRSMRIRGDRRNGLKPPESDRRVQGFAQACATR